MRILKESTIREKIGCLPIYGAAKIPITNVYFTPDNLDYVVEQTKRARRNEEAEMLLTVRLSAQIDFGSRS